MPRLHRQVIALVWLLLFALLLALGAILWIGSNVIQERADFDRADQDTTHYEERK